MGARVPFGTLTKWGGGGVHRVFIQQVANIIAVVVEQWFNVDTFYCLYT